MAVTHDGVRHERAVVAYRRRGDAEKAAVERKKGFVGGGRASVFLLSLPQPRSICSGVAEHSSLKLKAVCHCASNV